MSDKSSETGWSRLVMYTRANVKWMLEKTQLVLYLWFNRQPLQFD